MNTGTAVATEPERAFTAKEAAQVMRSSLWANYVRIEMANCENQLLGEIANKQFKRRDVAQTYWYAMNSSEKVDWAKVNKAIIERWSVSGLNWIKAQAW